MCKNLMDGIKSGMVQVKFVMGQQVSFNLFKCSILNVYISNLQSVRIPFLNMGHLHCVQDPEFWTHRPWTTMMKRVAADDVRFLLRIHERMLKSLTDLSKWRLSVRSSLYCRCFCAGDLSFLDCPLPALPGLNIPLLEILCEHLTKCTC